MGGFERWGEYEPEPNPLVIYDLNGKELFYDFTFRARQGDAERPAGVVRTSASRLIGTPVPSISLGPRTWDPKRATEEVSRRVLSQYPGAAIANTELVCYSYPKIGVRVDLDHPVEGASSHIFDVASQVPVTRFGSDELEGLTSYSFYDEIAEPDAVEKERRFGWAEEELEATRKIRPELLARRFVAGNVADIRASLRAASYLGSLAYISLYSSKVLKYAPRCSPHDCFALYAQQTDVYCAVATGQMILDFYRYNFDQDTIAAAMGTDAGGTDNTGQVAGYESLSNNSLDATYDTSANWSEAKAEIDANRPVKSGIPGHARACAGWMRQNLSLISQPQKRWLRIYDPWPWNADICQGGEIVWEDWDTVTHTNFIYVRHI